MPKDKKENIRKKNRNPNPSFQNDQLGENASEHMSNQYDNKQNEKKK